MELKDHIIKAIDEALIRGIEVNTIVIDKHLAMSEQFQKAFKTINGYEITTFPTMLFGLKCEYQNDLPNNANFILLKADNFKDYPSENEKLKKYIKQLKGTIKGLNRKLEREVNKVK